MRRQALTAKKLDINFVSSVAQSRVCDFDKNTVKVSVYSGLRVKNLYHNIGKKCQTLSAILHRLSSFMKMLLV